MKQGYRGIQNQIRWSKRIGLGYRSVSGQVPVFRQVHTQQKIMPLCVCQIFLHKLNVFTIRFNGIKYVVQFFIILCVCVCS